MVLLITRDDIAKQYPIGKNMDNSRILPYIRRAQESDVKPFLGEELYYDVITNQTTAPNKALLDGGSYLYQNRTIFFSGVKDLLVSWAYARVEQNNSEFVSRGGNVQKETEESESTGRAVLNHAATQAKSDAIRMQRELFQYMDQLRSDYPLWRLRYNQETPQTTSFKITKVHPRPTVQSRSVEDGIPSKEDRANDVRYGSRF